MNAAPETAKLVMRVLSPRMLPPVSDDDGSTASTATRWSSSTRRWPTASINVDLPDPGTPLTPTLWAPPVCGSSRASISSACCRWSGKVDSTSVIARPSVERSAARTPSTYASMSIPVTPPPPDPFPQPDRRRNGAIWLWKSEFWGWCSLGQLVEQRRRRLGDHRAGREDRRRAGLAQRIDVLRRDHPADDDEDVAAPQFGQRRLQLGHQREVAGRERRHADDVDVRLDRLAGDLGGRLEQRADIDVEAEVGEGRGDHLLTAVVTVLTDLGDQDPRLAAVVGGELLDHRPHLGDVGCVPDLLAV